MLMFRLYKIYIAFCLSILMAPGYIAHVKYEAKYHFDLQYIITVIINKCFLPLPGVKCLQVKQNGVLS
jgi:hypothetical protein